MTALKGIAIGGTLAVVLCAVQKATGIIRLNPESYAMSTVPIELGVGTVAAVAAGTLAVCVLAMLIPATYISSVEPAKSIKFD